MAKRLYGEEDLTRKTDVGKEDSRPHEALRAKLERRQEFKASYFSFTLISCFKALCCCYKRCCSKDQCRRKLDSHQKFLVAQERLEKETDI